MKQKLSIRRMRQHPDLEQLKRQSKELLASFRAADTAAVNEINAFYDDPQPATFALHDAQLVIARSYGFDSSPIWLFPIAMSIARSITQRCTVDRKLPVCSCERARTHGRVSTCIAIPRRPGRWHVNGVTTTLSQSSRKKRTARLNLRTSQLSLQAWSSITQSAPLWQMVI